jgi:hypothetical protein
VNVNDQETFQKERLSLKIKKSTVLEATLTDAGYGDRWKSLKSFYTSV